MRRIARVSLSVVLLAAIGCSDVDLTPTSWTDAWRSSPIRGSGWKSQKGAWSYSSKAREIEGNLGYE